MTIIFGCPIYERAWAVAGWATAIRTACDYANESVEIVCAYSESKDDTLDELHKHGIRVLDVGESPRKKQDVTDHIWGPPSYEHMAKVRNDLLAHVALRDPDWFFSLDSDIILPEKGLRRLVGTAYSFQASAIAPLVNLSENAAQPAWNYMQRNSLGMYWRPEHAINFPIKVAAIMAAMMIHRHAFGVQWAHHDSGEDLGFANNATKYSMFIDPQVVCEHRMRRPA